MNLQNLLRGVDVLSSVGDIDLEVNGIVSDHREVYAGCAFICYEGVNVDSHTFIQQAIQNGSIVVVGEKLPPTDLPPNVTYVQTPNGRIALSVISANWHNTPAAKLKLIGITGTNGKTSTAFFVHSIFKTAGIKSAIMGTVSHRFGDVTVPAATTTPDPFALHGLFARIANADIGYAIMETSSQGLAQHRLAGITFETAVFTNLTQDHLDYHQTMENYLNAKLMLFQQLRTKNGMAILNADDEVYETIRQRINLTVGHDNVLTYGLQRQAHLTARDVKSTLNGLLFTAVTPSGNVRVKLHLLGDYNLYNALAAIGVGLHHGFSLQTIKEGLESTVVPGRFERVDNGQDFAVVVDYAHTPDGLENLLASARKIAKGRLICVFGCGGDRDSGKRPKMGKISTTIADFSVITSDNPRTEDPDRIISDIVNGLPDGANYIEIVNRKAAIEHAIMIAEPGDLVAIAGKGHESYQEINGQRFHFDDREIASASLELLKLSK